MRYIKLLPGQLTTFSCINPLDPETRLSEHLKIILFYSPISRRNRDLNQTGTRGYWNLAQINLAGNIALGSAWHIWIWMDETPQLKPTVVRFIKHRHGRYLLQRLKLRQTDSAAAARYPVPSHRSPTDVLVRASYQRPIAVCCTNWSSLLHAISLHLHWLQDHCFPRCKSLLN